VKRNLVKHPDWNDIKVADKLLEEVREGKHPNLHTIEESVCDTIVEPREGHDDNEWDWSNIVTLTRKFIECRECGKTFGVIIYQNGTEVDFECIDCYNESVKDEIE